MWKKTFEITASSKVERTQGKKPFVSMIGKIKITCTRNSMIKRDSLPLKSVKIFVKRGRKGGFQHFLHCPFPNKPCFLRVCSTSLLKTLWEKEKLLVTSNFSFSHSVFYLCTELSAIILKSKIVVCKVFQFGRV